jgi:enamine deaminase RidA (YjgF/YER057c/UK114 family)
VAPRFRDGQRRAGFTQTPAVINGFSDLILELWGSEAGSHARSAVGLAELPFRIPVEIEAEVLIDESNLRLFRVHVRD